MMMFNHDSCSLVAAVRNGSGGLGRGGRAAGVFFWPLLLFLGMVVPDSATGQFYAVGQTVDPAVFSMENRVLWYRDDGQEVRPGDSLELSYFEGKIVFIEWFKYW